MQRCALTRRRELPAGGVRLPALRLPFSPFTCPACGLVHAAVRLRLLLVLGALLAGGWTLLPRSEIDVPMARVIHSRRTLRNARLESIQHSPGLKPGAMLPGAALTGENSPGDVLQVPRTAVIWNRAAGGTYLWSAPGEQIIGFLDNGAWVTLLDKWQSLGGVPFGALQTEGQAGWADMRHVHRLPQPEVTLLPVRDPSGAHLYAAPGGEALRWLPPGTPLLPRGEETGGWMPVSLLVGGLEGWLPSISLKNE